MTSSLLDPDVHVYKLLLVSPQDSRVCVHMDQAGMRLPCITINRYRRPADEITTSVLRLWSLDSIVIDWASDQSGTVDTAILELRSPCVFSRNSDISFIHIDELEAHQVSPDLTRLVRRMLSGDTVHTSRFSRFGWVDDVQAWIRRCVSSEAIEFTHIRQLNAGGNFALVRMNTQSGKAYWLKAVGSSNALEFSTTAFLAGNCPTFLPRIVDMRHDWNAWLMAEFGESLHSSSSLTAFERAASRLADLQKLFINKVDELLSLQLVDHRMTALKCRIDEVLAYLDNAMGKQVTTRVESISTTRMKQIGVLLHRACDVMQELGIPDSIMHGDISPGSILTDGSDCVFTDWCEAYVGNPFVTFELLCVHMANVATEPLRWRRAMTDSYKHSWSDVLTGRQIGRACQIAPLVAILSYLYGNGRWLHAPHRHHDSFLSYARSLARHMDRIASGPELRSLL